MSLRTLQQYKQLLRVTILFVCVVIIAGNGNVFAQNDSNNYGECAYGRSCPTPQQPGSSGGDGSDNGDTTFTPTPVPNPEPTVEPTETNSVTQDIDNDGNEETAIDGDNDASNGYEEFYDEDGSSVSIGTVKDTDGNTAYLIDTDGDGEADVYWEPSSSYVSAIVLRENEDGSSAYVFTDSSGDDQSVAVSPSDPRPVDTSIPQEQPRSQNAVVAQVEKLVKKVPKPAAYSFPYFLFFLIAVIIFRLFLQTRKEIERRRVIEETITREKQLAFEKKNFLSLASHYLRTPITILTGNIELMQMQNRINDSQATALKASTQRILQESNDILTSIEKDAALQQIPESVNGNVGALRMALSPLVLAPIVCILGLIALGHFLFITFEVTAFNVVDLLVQLLLAVLLVQIFVSSFRKRSINKQNRADKERVLTEQRHLDEARRNVIAQASERLTEHIQNMGNEISKLTQSRIDTTKLHAGYDKLLDITNKFVFANKLLAHEVRMQRQQVSAQQAIDTTLETYKESVEQKKLSVTKPRKDVQLEQNPQMLGVLISSLIDNAIRYSRENDHVIIHSAKNKNQFTLSVEDTGPGLSEQQLATLFKPFTRGESAETFNTEGLGFSLYLDKLIAHYLQGDLTISSQPNRGTTARIELPA